ncbi:TonB-dependent receptor [Aquabacterium sp. OR-4]|uniref:TonB-dependent receptor n=1 Tax=Aquabacterium sp. OR-4 TaxID=2978127 RepID=UPI0021B405AB|nr:TonB-dependent receptor [Aquabacterium sp. OR-4]MDT7837994.1 TonB-dependent receptor [Aquabacterium sp. OR-4]
MEVWPDSVAREFARVPRKTYLDLQLSYQWRKQQQFYAGVNNLFDTQAPPVITGLPGTVTGTETDASTYDAIGHRFYLGWRLWL